MKGTMEQATCSMCGTFTIVARKFYHYEIICECCSDRHIEVVQYCSACKPVPPEFIKLALQPTNG